MRIQRIIDACALMQTKDQAGMLEKLTKLHVEVEKDPAGWLCDWWECFTGLPEYQQNGYRKLGRMLVRIAGDKLQHLEKDLELTKRELDLWLASDKLKRLKTDLKQATEQPELDRTN